MTYTISKDFGFAAAHHLPLLPPEHQCSRVHGHNYLVRVEVSTEHLNADEMVLDYAALGFIGEYLDEELDHRDLNQVFWPADSPEGDEDEGNPTAEFLAACLWEVAWDGLREAMPEAEFSLSVGVSETPKTWAWFTR